jgi:hypothetical protein
MRDDSYQEVARVDRNWYIRDDCGQELGRFDNDGYIRDDCGQEKGRVDNYRVVKMIMVKNLEELIMSEK